MKADALAMAAAAAARGGSGAAASSGEPGSAHSKAKIALAYSQARALLDRSLRVVREIAWRLGSSPGRKSLVLVTEGFPADPSLDVFRGVREESARSNVVLHFLDARGLATGPEFLSAAGTTEVPNQDIGPTLALWRLEDAGSKALAQETGGLVLQTNDLVAGLETVADEVRAYYLLGYEPSNAKRDGRYRKLKVEVLRPGLSARARAGYFAPKGKEKPAPEPSVVDRVLRNPFDADGVPLRLAAYVMGEAPLASPVPKTGVEVLIGGEVRLDSLATRSQDGRIVAEPRLTLRVGSREGESHESDWTLEIALSDSAASAKAWHPFLTRDEHPARLSRAARCGARRGDGSAAGDGELRRPLRRRARVGERRGDRDDPRVRETDPPGEHPLWEAPEGESELVLSVRDEVSGRGLEAREPFRVERGGNLPPPRDLDGAQ